MLGLGLGVGWPSGGTSGQLVMIWGGVVGIEMATPSNEILYSFIQNMQVFTNPSDVACK